MFIVVPKTQAERIRKALAKLEGLPRRATVTRSGVSDLALTEQLGAALDTTDCVEVGDDDGATACIELPVALEKHLGKTIAVGQQPVVLPARADLAADEAALPKTLRDVRQAKRDDASVKASAAKPR